MARDNLVCGFLEVWLHSFSGGEEKNAVPRSETCAVQRKDRRRRSWSDEMAWLGRCAMMMGHSHSWVGSELSFLVDAY